MVAVNWNDPSDGIVSDPKPALTLRNNKDGALLTRSRGIGVVAVAPRNTAILGGNQTGLIAAVAGGTIADPSASSNLGGIGLLGVTDRHAATAVSGVALRERSIGVLGRAEDVSIGVVGQGGLTGVEGTALRGNGVAGFTKSPGDDAGVYGRSQGDGGAGVRGIAVAGPGVDAFSTAGPGLRASSDQAAGVLAESKAGNAAGVFGRNDVSTGVGVDAFSQNGIAARAISSKGTALHAETFSGTGVKVQSQLASAIDAYSLAGTGAEVKSGRVAIDAFGLTSAVYANAMSPPGPDPKSGAAIQAGNFSSGAGIKGITFNGAGVHGIGVPVLGAWAGLFEGNVSVQGILFKYASLFSIDHPLDPDRKVLNHASVESPEYKTFYDGVATLDGGGKAVVRLPRWFAALNGELRHQVTAMGAPAPDLHVRNVRRDSFVVAGGGAGQKVCWQVTGVRRDAWARANPLQVEQRRRLARPDIPATTAADIRRLRAAARKKLQDLREEAPRGARRRPAALVRPRIDEALAPGLGSRTVPVQSRATIRAARRAMKK